VLLCKVKLPGQCCTQDVCTSVIVTEWSLQRGKKGTETSLSIDSTRLIVVMLCFTGVMQLLVAGMNLYEWQCLAWRDGWRTIIRWCYIAWYVSCLHCYCTHVMGHNGTLKDCLIDVELSTSMYLFYRDILWDFHMNLGENLKHTEQDLWRTFIVFQKDGAV